MDQKVNWLCFIPSISGIVWFSEMWFKKKKKTRLPFSLLSGIWIHCSLFLKHSFPRFSPDKLKFQVVGLNLGVTPWTPRLVLCFHNTLCWLAASFFSDPLPILPLFYCVFQEFTFETYIFLFLFQKSPSWVPPMEVLMEAWRRKQDISPPLSALGNVSSGEQVSYKVTVLTN